MGRQVRYEKYEHIFRRDHENAFSTCVAAKCGAGLLDHYNTILYALQNATGEKTGPFGKRFTWDEYQNYKNIYSQYFTVILLFNFLYSEHPGSKLIPIG